MVDNIIHADAMPIVAALAVARARHGRIAEHVALARRVAIRRAHRAVATEAVLNAIALACPLVGGIVTRASTRAVDCGVAEHVALHAIKEGWTSRAVPASGVRRTVTQSRRRVARAPMTALIRVASHSAVGTQIVKRCLAMLATIAAIARVTLAHATQRAVAMTRTRARLAMRAVKAVVARARAVSIAVASTRHDAAVAVDVALARRSEMTRVARVAIIARPSILALTLSV